MLALEHPLAGLTSVQEVLASLIAKDLDERSLGDQALDSGMPIEYFQFLVRGLARDRTKRYASVAVMEEELRALLSGRIPARCHISLTKNVTHRFLHWIDRHPRLYTILLFFFVLGTLTSIVSAVVRLARWRLSEGSAR